MYKTYTVKAEEINREWVIVDASNQVLGRLASQIATILRGKHKPSFSPHLDLGDYVIVINAQKIRTTGKRMDTKMYYRHSGYPGGLKSIVLRDLLQKDPERVIRSAVKGMLPQNRLGRAMIKKLKVYPGEDHPHAAQNPRKIEL